MSGAHLVVENCGIAIRVLVQRGARPRLCRPTTAIATCEQAHIMKLKLGFILSSADERSKSRRLRPEPASPSYTTTQRKPSRSCSTRRRGIKFKKNKPTSGLRPSNTSVPRMWVELLEQQLRAAEQQPEDKFEYTESRTPRASGNEW